MSGQPELDKESRRSGCFAYIILSVGGAMLVSEGFVFGPRGASTAAVGVAGTALVVISAILVLFGHLRRQWKTAGGSSPERVAWDHAADGIYLREFDAERFVPYADIEKCWSSPRSLLSPRMKLQLETRGDSRLLVGFPTIMLCGPAEMQHEAAQAIRDRIAAGQQSL